uniref:ATP synthase complex subunit 8 n=1 Tax=Phyllotreta tetrastigma TaxID=1315190 RepID=A0A1P8NNB6_9CUCU|nr:ATP synthase F0 subunit 8 [Phyllotreta tetrastigma]
MPQMMPMNWLILMIYFIMFYYLMVNLNFYSFKYQPETSNISKTNNLNLWKW